MLNFFVFFLEIFVPDFYEQMSLFPNEAIYGGKVWQFLTFMFIHSLVDPLHILLNMFVLFMFGPTIEIEFGRKKFLIFYLICGIGSALLHIFLVFTYPTLTNPENIAAAMTTPLIGASGAVMGLLTAFAIMFPKRIIFFNFIPMPAIAFLIIYGAIELLSGISGIETGVAHFGHLGGIATALILLYGFKFKKRKKIEFIWEYR